MKPSENALTILEKRYFIENEDWDGLCKRVAREVSMGNKELEEQYFDAMNNFYFLPNSPTLMNAGTGLNNLSACFKINLEDSMDSIMDAAKKMALIFKEAGGVGIALDNIRERDASVKTTKGAASGVVSFMELYNTVAEVVKGGGKRRAALMCALRVDHPEILDFIKCKDDLNKFNNCNISVSITDDFMEKAEHGLDYDLISPINGKVGTLNAREVLLNIAKQAHKNGEPGLLFVDTANNKDKTPQFGRMNGTNPCFRHDTLLLTKEYGEAPIGSLVQQRVTIWNGFEWSKVVPRITGKNQEMLRVVCSEIGLTRTSFNQREVIVTKYHSFYVYDTFGKAKMITAQELKPGMEIIPFFESDNAKRKTRLKVDEVYILPDKEKEVFCLNEPISHAIVANGILTGNCGEQWLRDNSSCNLLSINMLKVQSDEDIERYSRLAVRFLNSVIDVGKYPLQEITETVKKERNIGLGVMGWADYLATKRIPYDSQQGRIEAKRISKLINDAANDESIKIAKERGEYIETIDGVKRYNGTLTCIAPTGTISMIVDCSSGIEPYFALSYGKNVMDGHSFRYFNPILKSILEEDGLWCSEVKSQIAKTGSIQNIDTIPQPIKEIFKTASEIGIIGHVKMQAAWQEYIENSISKTINLSRNSTVDDVLLAYILAYQYGCKGITVYRDGSRSNQVLTSPKSKIERCPECSSKELSHNSGCVTCLNCGWSACSIS